MNSVPTTMTGWRQDSYGGADTVGPHTTETPTPASGEVLLEIESCALNAGDVHLMRGDPWLVRLGFGLRRPRQAVRGMDVSARIVDVGKGVDRGRIGESVVTELRGGGGLAPYAVAPDPRAVTRPATVDANHAACLPIAGGTAQQALDLADVADGQRILVIGASGGVGSFTVQLAAARGAEVHALCGAANRDLVESLGASRTWDYRNTDPETLPGAYGAIIDVAGTTPLRTLKTLLAPAGTLVLVAGVGGRLLGPIPRILGALLLSAGSRRKLRPLAAAAKPDVLAALLDEMARGRIRAVIEQEFELEDARDALARQDSGRVVGKVIVRIARTQVR